MAWSIKKRWRFLYRHEDDQRKRLARADLLAVLYRQFAGEDISVHENSMPRPARCQPQAVLLFECDNQLSVRHPDVRPLEAHVVEILARLFCTLWSWLGFPNYDV
jgi:hypothetical protein